MNVKKTKGKPKYEPPVIMKLGELARGLGGSCGTGGSANRCSTGSVASASCAVGSGAANQCRPGGVASNCRSGTAG